MPKGMAKKYLKSNLFIFYYFFLIYSNIPSVEDVSHKIKGLRSLSIDHSSSLKRAGFSFLKDVSMANVVCKFDGDSLLCSNKKACFLVITNYVTIILKNQAISSKSLLLV